LKLDEDTLADLRLTIGRRLTPKPVKVRADVEVKCFAYQGIEAIKKALGAGEACSTQDVQIKIRLVAPPLYVMSTTSTDKTAAIEVMEKAVERIGEVIAEEKGDLTIKMAVSQARARRRRVRAGMGKGCLVAIVSFCPLPLLVLVFGRLRRVETIPGLH
jgi:translation initiation factor 2 alpha subunit (eIF-2alpha)